ncbi:MAG: elongation factor G [Phycisphaerae bacterium]|nr:elongation factor G [Phycisphaerae bacterium]
MAQAVKTADIRNVVITGHGLSGKTTLIERLLAHAKVIPKMGSVQEKNTVCDYEPEEKTHGHSLTSKVVHLPFEGRHINLVDTPGSADFLGQSIGVLPAAECIAVVVDAAAGIQVTTRRIMTIAAELGVPRLIIVNKIDHEGVDLAGLLDQIHQAFGNECIPINLPIRNNTDVVDVFDHDHAEQGAEPAIMTVEAAHTHIYEQIVEMDEELTGEYFEKGDKLDPVKVHKAMESALRAGHLIPVCFCSARTGAGVEDLLHIIAGQCPSPLEAGPPHLQIRHDDGHVSAFEPDPASADKPAVAHVFKIIHDPFVGKLAVFRVLQGVVRTKSELLHGESRKPVRLNHLMRIRGKEHQEVDHVVAGDIGCVPKVDELKFNSILHADAAVHLLPPKLPLPKPLYGVAVELKNHADETKFSGAIHKMSEEDPCFHMERVAATGQTVLRGLGELHLRIAMEKLKTRFGIELITHPPKVAYKETITGRADGHHRHKKQTGGAGQFGEVYLRVAPLPPDHPEGFEFENATVGGSIPRQFMPAIEKGVRQVLSSGAVAGYPMVGVRVEVYDGKYHAVDSKEVAFIAAGKKAFIDAVSKARPALLEPFVNVEITAPSRYLGDITADLSGKRGRVQSTDVLGSDICIVRATAPLSELQNYSNELKSMTGGQGSYSMDYSHDERTPATVQAAVIAAYKPRAEED